MAYYSTVLREDFGISDETARPALPRMRLKMFGGDMDIEEFRASFSKPYVERMENPRFLMQNPQFVEVSAKQISGVAVGGVPSDSSTQQRLEEFAKQVISSTRDQQQPAAMEVEGGSDTALQSAPGNDVEFVGGVSIFERFMNQMKQHKGDAEKARSAVAKEIKRDAGGKKEKAGAVKKQRLVGGGAPPTTQAAAVPNCTKQVVN